MKLKKTVLLSICLSFLFTNYSQQILKENISTIEKTYWDFKKTKIQSEGAYYKDKKGASQDKHGTWKYYNEDGVLIETSSYFKNVIHGKVMMAYQNGKIKQEGFFKLGIQDSSYKEWFENGMPALEGFYKNNKKVNVWNRYYYNGKLESVEQYLDTISYLLSYYSNDSIHTQQIKDGSGNQISYFPTNLIHESYTYKEGLRNGDFYVTNINGKTGSTGSYRNGFRHGIWNYFYFNGDKEKTCCYQNGLLDGSYASYYDTKQLKVIGEYRKGMKNGKWIWYTNTGVKDMEGYFLNDKQDGDWVYYFPTGDISYTAHFKEDKKEGKWIYFYKTKEKFKECTYLNDQKSGIWQTWYENGTLLMTGNYTAGLEEGKWENYWENGKLKNVTSYQKGLLHGNWKSFSPTGNLLLDGQYKTGYKNGKWLKYFVKNSKLEEINTYKIIVKKDALNYGFWAGRKIKESVRNGLHVSYSSKDDSKMEEGNYKNDEKHGEWKAFFEGGESPAVISNYKKGELHGLMTEYGRKREKISETHYKLGVKQGSMKLYDKQGKIKLEKEFQNGQQVK